KYTPAVFLQGLTRMRQHAFAQRGPKVLVGHGFSTEAEHGEVCREQAIEHQIIERGNQAAARQIAGSAEDDECARLDRSEGFLSGSDIDPWRGRHGCDPTASRRG